MSRYASKEKRKVTVVHTISGPNEPIRQHTYNSRRTVYTRQDGSEYVNWMGWTRDLEDGVLHTESRLIGKASLGELSGRHTYD